LNHQASIRICSNDADKRRSLDIHNIVWPLTAITRAEASSCKSSVRD
jgi:hypothetical protein